MKNLIFSIPLLAILVSCSPKEPNKEAEIAPRKPPKLTMQLLVNDPAIFDTIKMLASYTDIISGKFITDTIRFNHNGSAIFAPKAPPLYPFETNIEMIGKWRGLLLLHQGVNMTIDLRDTSIDWREDNFNMVASFSGADSLVNTVANSYLSFDTTKQQFWGYSVRLRNAKTAEQLQLVYDSFNQVLLPHLEKYKIQYGLQFHDYLQTTWMTAMFRGVFLNCCRRNEEPSERIMVDLANFNPSYFSFIINNNFYRNFCYMYLYITKAEQMAYLYGILKKEGNESSALEKHFMQLYEQEQLIGSFDEKAINEVFFELKEQYQAEIEPFENEILIKKMQGFSATQQDWFLWAKASNDVVARYNYFTQNADNFKTAEMLQLVMQTQETLEPVANKISEQISQKHAKTQVSELGLEAGTFGFGAALYLCDLPNTDSLLKALRRKFPNNTLIIDIWGTWCSPCKQDMKSSKNVKEDIKQMGAEVIYISTEGFGSQNKWKQVIAELECAGTHILLSKKLANNLTERFIINEYPTVLILNNEGTDAQNLGYTISKIKIDEFAANYLQKKQK